MLRQAEAWSSPWFKLMEIGIQGKFLNVIKSLYDKARSRVSGSADFISITQGIYKVKNYLRYSSIWHCTIWQIILRVKWNQISSSQTLLSLSYWSTPTTRSYLQLPLRSWRLLYTLQHYCQRNHLETNASKIIIFNGRAKTCKHDFFIGNIEKVENLHYLGINMQWNLKFTKHL